MHWAWRAGPEACSARGFSRRRRIITGDANKRVRDHLQEELKKPIRVKLKDKLSFSGGVGFLLLSQYMVLLCVRARVGCNVALVLPFVDGGSA